jgi:hypothetical protein
MSVAVAHPRERASRLAGALAADRAAVVGLALLVALLVGVTWGTWGDLGSDTGYDLVAGTRVAHGHLPYADFVYYYGPLGPMLLGAAMWIGGVGVGASLAVGIALAVAIVAATYLLGRDLAGRAGGVLAGAIVAPLAFDGSNFSYVQPHSLSAPLGILAALVVLIGLGRARTGESRWLVAAGFAAGVTALTRPEFELAVLAALAVWLLVRRRTATVSRSEISALAAPAVAVPAIVYGAFLTQVSLHSLLFDNLYPTKVLHAGGNAILRLHAPLTASSFVRIGEKLVLYAVGTAALLGAAAWLARAGRRGTLAAAGVGVVALAVLAVRPETVRFYLEYAYGWIPAAAVIALAAVVVRRRASLLAPREAALVAVLAVLAAKTYDAYAFHAHIPQLAVYSAPFAAVFMAWLHLVRLPHGRTAVALGASWLAFLAVAGVALTVKDARAESFTVHGPGGSMTARPADGRLLQSVVGEIERRTRPGDAILLAPQLTALYTLTARVDPLPQLSLVPGALPTRADELGAIARLQKARVRLVVVDERSFPEYDQTTFGASFDRTLAAWIHAHYSRAVVLQTAGAGAHRVDIYVRRAP